MNVKCPKCLTPIKAENMNIQTGTAVCANCHHLFHLEAGWEQEDKDVSYKKITEPPTGFSTVPSLSGLEIRIATRVVSKGWWEFWFGFAFLIIPSIFVVVISVAPSEEIGANIYFIYAFLSIFFAVGIYVLWEGLTKILNTVSVKVDAAYLEVSSLPINWGKHKTRRYPIDEIEQVFVRRYSNKSQNGRPVYEYAVDFLSGREGKTAWILKGFTKPEQAWYLEQKLERHLHLDEKHVIGEFDPSDNYRPSLKDVFSAVKESWKK
jgi:hypothetical protein